MLARSGAAFLSAPDDVEAMAEHIATLYTRWCAGTLPSPSEEYVAQFDRQRLTGQLARVFENVLHVDGHETVGDMLP